MSDLRRADKRDANEAEIVKFWQALGYVWVPGKPGQGYDGLLITPLDVYVVEIKNPDTRWKLTDSEKKLSEEMERLGQMYYIIENMKDAKWLAGVV